MSRFEIKIVAALLLIAVIPLAASVVLVGQVIRVSDSVAEGQTRRMAGPLRHAADAYRQLFEAHKRVFRLEGRLLAQDRQLVAALAPLEPQALERRLRELISERAEAGVIAVRSSAGRTVARVSRLTAFPAAKFRSLKLSFPLGPGAEESTYTLSVRFFTDRAPFDDFARLGQVQRTSAEIAQLRDELALYYRVAFLIMFGAVALAATGIGLFIARRTTRRVAVLAQATRRVAEGDLETRVHLRSRDELGDLARSFNEMVQQIKESGERISYLEKIGAWQEIARRLAHEIKNPLTPIQLAVQQLHRKYGDEDPKFRRLLDDATDIVTEEIEGLRRLVRAFSAFAKLPTVQPEPVDINSVLEDFLKSYSDLAERAQVTWEPAAPSFLVLVDRMLIKHVLYNLVENAIHAAEDVGTLPTLGVTLEVTSLPRARRARLTVSDSGPGMQPEVAQRVFDPYFTTKERGTGLGLAIVKKIVLEHRGAITVASTPGAGTRFELTLPMG